MSATTDMIDKAEDQRVPAWCVEYLIAALRLIDERLAKLEERERAKKK